MVYWDYWVDDYFDAEKYDKTVHKFISYQIRLQKFEQLSPFFISSERCLGNL